MNDTVISVSALKDSPYTEWAVNAGFGYEHNPCPLLSTGKLVVAGTKNGMLVAIDEGTRKVIWKYKAGNSSVNKVVVDKSNTFWITLMEGKIQGFKAINDQ